MSKDISLENIENLRNLILPRLEAIKNSANGATIHEANRLIMWINAYYYSAKKSNSLVDRVICREYIRTAEDWLIEMGKKL